MHSFADTIGITILHKAGSSVCQWQINRRSAELRQSDALCRVYFKTVGLSKLRGAALTGPLTLPASSMPLAGEPRELSGTGG